MKRYLSIFLILLLVVLGWYYKSKTLELPSRPFVIIFENDVHCAIDGYAKLATLKEQQQLETPYVATVSCGDFIQGDIIGSLSKGEGIVDLMNEVKYDVV